MDEPIKPSRRKRRRLNRIKLREAKHDKSKAVQITFDNTITLDALYRAYLLSKLGVSWKKSTQKASITLLENLHTIHKEMIAGKDMRMGFIQFTLFERGKARFIQSVHFRERIVQRVVCDEVLSPLFTPTLIYDNGASIKNKGIQFAIKRAQCSLERHYRKYGRNGYVIQIDFSSYFANISHKKLKEIFEHYIKDKKLFDLCWSFVAAFGNKGLGLGSQVSQAAAGVFMNRIDHYAKEVLKLKAYVRYADDTLIIVKTKEEAERILTILREWYKQYEIVVNEKKTKIVKLTKGFTFLKTQFFVEENGKIVKRICRKGVTAMRRKLKKFIKFVNAGCMSFGQAYASFQSWKSYAEHKNTFKTVLNMTRLFYRIFANTPKEQKEVKLWNKIVKELNTWSRRLELVNSFSLNQTISA